MRFKTNRDEKYCLSSEIEVSPVEKVVKIHDFPRNFICKLHRGILGFHHFFNWWDLRHCHYGLFQNIRWTFGASNVPYGLCNATRSFPDQSPHPSATKENIQELQNDSRGRDDYAPPETQTFKSRSWRKKQLRPKVLILVCHQTRHLGRASWFPASARASGGVWGVIATSGIV